MTALLQPASLYPLIMRLRYILDGQRREVTARLPMAIRTGLPLDLSHWTGPMVHALKPAMTPYWQAGLLRGRREVARVLEGWPLPQAAPILRHLRRGPHLSKTLLRQRRKDFNIGMAAGAFHLHNPSVRDAIERATFLFCQTTNDTATTDLNKAIARLRVELDEGIEAGESFRDLGNRVRDLFDTPRADMIARQECLPGGTVISGARVNGAYRRLYRGPMVKIVTENGLEFSGTPNHPVLTRRGWVALDQLNEFDYLVTDPSQIKNPGMISRAGNENVATPPATLGQIFDSLLTVGIRGREIGRQPDFHGDGRNGYVDVLRSNSVLRYGMLATSEQLVEDGFLSPSDFQKSGLTGESDSFYSRFIIRNGHCFAAMSNGHSGANQFLNDSSSLNAELARQFTGSSASNVALNDRFHRNAPEIGVDESPSELGFASKRSISRHSGSSARLDNDGFVATELVSNHQRTHAAPIKLDRVRFLIRSQEDFDFHVYNLSTEDGFYVANGLYTKNCSRALNGGSVIAYEKAGCEGSAWLATSNPCPACFELDGEERRFGEPFAVKKGGGPYSVVYNPPLHPNCFLRLNWSSRLLAS